MDEEFADIGLVYVFKTEGLKDQRQLFLAAVNIDSFNALYNKARENNCAFDSDSSPNVLTLNINVGRDPVNPDYKACKAFVAKISQDPDFEKQSKKGLNTEYEKVVNSVAEIETARDLPKEGLTLKMGI